MLQRLQLCNFVSVGQCGNPTETLLQTRRKPPADSQGLHFPIESAASNPKFLSCSSDIPVETFEHLKQFVVKLPFGPGLRQTKVLSTDERLFNRRGDSLYHRSQFTNISGPCVAVDRLKGAIAEFQVLCFLVHETPSQCLDVAHPFPQRRHLDLEGRQTVCQILSKLTAQSLSGLPVLHSDRAW